MFLIFSYFSPFWTLNGKCLWYPTTTSGYTYPYAETQVRTHDFDNNNKKPKKSRTRFLFIKVLK